MRILLFSLMVVLSVGACKEDHLQGNSSKSVDAIRQEKGGVADIIRNPVTADGPLDTVNVAKISFEATEYDFGMVDEGAEVIKTFNFTNTGKIPLIISDARSTCGCTVPDWPKNPVPPGGEGEIKVVFQTKGKPNRQNKPVTITANTYPAQTKIYLNGFVRPEKNGEGSE